MPSKIQQTLARHRLGVPAILAIIMSAAAPMSGLAGGAASSFATTGLLAIPLGNAVITIFLVLWAPGYLSLSHLANAGSVYGYVRHGLGRVPGVAAGGVAVVAYNLMQVGFYGGWGLACAQFTAALGAPTPWWGWALAAWLVVGVLGTAKIDLSGRVLMVLLAGEIVILLVFLAVFVANGPQGPSPAALNPAQLAQPGMLPVLAIGFSGFVGLESSATFSEEAKSRAAMTRAILAAIVASGVLYTAGTWALTVATGPDHIVAAASAHGTDLVFHLAGAHLGPGIVLAARLLYATSMFAGLLAWHNVANRYFFALGREGVLPRGLTATSRSGGPQAAAITQSALAGVVLAAMLLTGADPMATLFYGGTVGGAFGVLLLIVATGIGVLSYWLARPANDRPRTRLLIATAVGTLGLATIAVTTLAQFHTLLGLPAGSLLAWALPSSYAAAAVAGAGWAMWLRHRRPRVWRRLGYGTSAALTDADEQQQAPTPDRHTSPAATQLTSQPLAAALPAATTRELEAALSTLMTRGVDRHAALDAIVRHGLGQPEAVVADVQHQQHQQVTDREIDTRQPPGTPARHN